MSNIPINNSDKSMNSMEDSTKDISDEISTQSQTEIKSTIFKRFGWLILIWSLSVLALALFAYGIRIIMNFVGLTTH